MGIIASPRLYDVAARQTPPIGKAATPYDFALRLAAAAYNIATGQVTFEFLPLSTFLDTERNTMDFTDAPAAFIRAACVAVDGSWHASGTLDEAQAILASHRK